MWFLSVFPGTLRRGLRVIEWVSTEARCLHLRGSLIMNQWQSPCPRRPGLCDPPSCDESRNSQKTILKFKPWTTIFHVECQFCPLVLGEPSALNPQSKAGSHCTIIVIIPGVHCTTYFRWEARAIPNYWRNSWCTACTISVVSGFQASNSLYSSRFCPKCVTGIFWNKHIFP